MQRTALHSDAGETTGTHGREFGGTITRAASCAPTSCQRHGRHRLGGAGGGRLQGRPHGASHELVHHDDTAGGGCGGNNNSEAAIETKPAIAIKTCFPAM